MRRIQRKSLNLDLAGELLSAKFEHLQDNEDGTVEEINTTSISRCQSCGRPVQIDEIRGTCLSCHRLTCSLCSGFCECCKRGPYCGTCRSGFSEKKLSVCISCRDILSRRLAYEDNLLREKTDFERTLQMCGAQMKFIELLRQNTGKIPALLAFLSEIQIAHKLTELGRRTEEKNNGRRLLP